MQEEELEHPTWFGRRRDTFVGLVSPQQKFEKKPDHPRRRVARVRVGSDGISVMVPSMIPSNPKRILVAVMMFDDFGYMWRPAEAFFSAWRLTQYPGCEDDGGTELEKES
jgi:hypothetical protein